MFEQPILNDPAFPSTPQFAVFGHPIAHSKSPAIHTAFGHQLGIDLAYRAVDVGDGDLPRALVRFAQQGGVGGNVTLPYKRDAVACCASLSERARRAGVVNTLKRMGDTWFGDNTDGQGLVQDITERHRLDLRARRVLMLGAGGAAQAVLPALLDAGVDTVMISNRNPVRADALGDFFGEPARVRTAYWDDLGGIGHFDLVINATSAGVTGKALDLPFSLLSHRTLAYDLSYGPAASLFLSWAKAGEAWRAIDGFGMLVEQAALAFELWFGSRPDTELVYQSQRPAT